jgi:hypothetical protein
MARSEVKSDAFGKRLDERQENIARYIRKP